MRTLILSSPSGRPQFQGATRRVLESLPHHARQEVAAKCGCVWTGLVSRGGAYSDGQLRLCQEHAVADDETFLVYIDAARQLVDMAPDDDSDIGAIGSNWQPGYSRERAEVVVAECLASGYRRGHETSPRF